MHLCEWWLGETPVTSSSLESLSPQTICHGAQLPLRGESRPQTPGWQAPGRPAARLLVGPHASPRHCIPALGTGLLPPLFPYHSAVWTVSGGRPLPIILPGSASMWLLKSFIQVYLDNCIVLGFCWICKLKRLYKVFRILGIISHFIVRWILSCVWLEDPWKRHSLHLLQFIFVDTQ